MKKFLLALAVLGGTSLAGHAQSKDGGKFNIGLEAGLPLGDAKDVSSVALGASVKYELPVADKAFFTISGGYTRFLYKGEVKDALKSFGIDKSGEGFIPVKAGIKYYFGDNFFGEAQAGATFSTENGGGTAFAYAPGIGYTFASGFEAGVRYEGWSHDGSLNQAALRLGFRF